MYHSRYEPGKLVLYQQLHGIAWKRLAGQCRTRTDYTPSSVSPELPVTCHLQSLGMLGECQRFMAASLSTEHYWWAPVDINDSGCTGLKSEMYPSGYPGPVNQDYVLNMFSSLMPIVSEYYFINDPDSLPSSFRCPAVYRTQEFVQGSCVKLVQGSHISTQAGIVLNPFFSLAWCTYICCTTTIAHCYNTETNTVQTVVQSSSGPPRGCDALDRIAPPPSGTILSTTCRSTCPINP